MHVVNYGLTVDILLVEFDFSFQEKGDDARRADVYGPMERCVTTAVLRVQVYGVRNEDCNHVRRKGLPLPGTPSV
ncbi:hypothetical protein MARPO_0021s0049 [Marchantia polymorpha]|uniref:Uncharacterized protein n=1 Tax=Marchantia polymorpha TaxID=3197 RepID=A0A2R6XDN4_MARPO|nr:hypothetical protein MARPO_0021s0049 [Marchantia polymorpha]|eukprot:PTQ44179.1 hypothetical protein MARPO_0021s0049 [Marchantia polymorpha]